VQIRKFTLAVVAALVIGTAFDVSATSLITVVGGGFDDARPATLAQLAAPTDANLDPAGNLYIADSGRHRVRKVDAVTKVITTVAGNGRSDIAGDGALATAAEVGQPEALALDAMGNIYISERTAIRRVDAVTGIITTVAGDGRGGNGGDGGPAVAAGIMAEGLTVDAAGNVYIADFFNHRIRKVTAATGIISTVAGTGVAGFSGDGGPATAAQLRFPQDVAVDSAGNLYIADTFSHRIRKVDAATQIISTIAGSEFGFAGDGGPASQARLAQPNGLFVDGAGNVYIADTNNSRIRRVDATTQVITTVAGSGTVGDSGDGGPASAAAMIRPEKVAVDAGGNIYITDTVGRIRVVDAATNIIRTAAGGGAGAEGIHAQTAVLTYPVGAAFDAAGNMYVSAGARVYRVDAHTRLMVVFAGLATGGFGGDGGPARDAGFASTGEIALDGDGNVYVTDFSRVRKISAGTNIITTIAGNGTPGFSGDGGPAGAASLGFLIRIAVDAAGNLFVADSMNHRIRMVNAGTQQITTVAGNGEAGFSGDGGPASAARLDFPEDVAVDSAGNLYIMDGGSRVRRVEAGTGIITTVAGNGEPGLGGVGGPATEANLTSAISVTVDAGGNIYISDRGSQYVKKVDAATGIITNIAGNNITGFAGDVAPAASPLGHVSDIAIDPAGAVYLVDSDNHRIRLLGDVHRRRAVRRE
jgi:sugar lactone lactonase YvrE